MNRFHVTPARLAVLAAITAIVTAFGGTPALAQQAPAAPPAPCGQFEQCVDDGQLEQAPVDQAAPTSTVDPTDPYPYTVQQYMDYIIGDLDREWSTWFVNSGFEEPYVIVAKIDPGQQITSACMQRPLSSDERNAYYCAADQGTFAGRPNNGSIILPVETFQKMWAGDLFGKKSKTVGDFAAAVIIAHEFGHHVQDELRTQFNARGTGGQVAHPVSPNKELIADCFAGNWMASAYHSGLLTDTDLDEGVAALIAIGDPPTGGTHGSPRQRRAALLTGYHGLPGETAPGAPEACFRTYWK